MIIYMIIFKWRYVMTFRPRGFSYKGATNQTEDGVSCVKWESVINKNGWKYPQLNSLRKFFPEADR